MPFQRLIKTKTQTQMKKILVLIPVFLLAFQISKAQTEKGSQTLGLDLQFSHLKSTQSITQSTVVTSDFDTKLTNFSIGPNYSYFIADKLDIGVNLNYGYSSQNNQNPGNPGTQKSHQYGGQLFLRKYFMFGDKLGLRAGPYVGYSRDDFKSTDTYSIINTKTDNYQVGANLALVYYPAKKLGISATLANANYNHYKQKDGARETGHGDNFNFNIINDGLGLSVFYVFGGK